MLRTKLCDALGIRFPIVQAPIGSASTPELAAAVSEAGGLGTIALSWTSLDDAREKLQAIRSLTNKPFAINLALAWPQSNRLEICLSAGVPIISTFWGDPTPYRSAIRAGGAMHLHTVGSAEEARKAVDAGVDVVVAQGWEAGGHVWGEVTTLALVPRVVDAVGSAPVIAAGGIADGRGIVAAFALGASGVWMGTRFLLAEEAFVSHEYRTAIIDAVETDTVHSELFDVGWPDAPHRTLRNSTITNWEDAGRPNPPERPGENECIARHHGTEVLRYSDMPPLADMEGDLEALALYAGQGVGLVDAVKPAAEIVQDLVREASETVTRL